MYYGYRCYNKESQPVGWLYTYDNDTEYTWTNENLDWCKRWKTEKGAKKNLDRYNSRWQFKSGGGFLKIEVMPHFPEPEPPQSRRQKLLEEWGDDAVVARPQEEGEQPPMIFFQPKPEVLQWLDEKRLIDNGQPESISVLLNRKLEKVMKLEQQGF